MFQLTLKLLGGVLFAITIAPIGLAALAVALFCLGVSVVVIGSWSAWAVSRAFLWFIANSIISRLPLLTRPERDDFHQYVNSFFGYPDDAHLPLKPLPSTSPTTPRPAHLQKGMTSQEYLSRRASLGSLAQFPEFDEDIDYNEIEDDAIFMAFRNRSVQQPPFDVPFPESLPGSRRSSRSASIDVSRVSREQRTPAMYSAFTDSMRPPSRNGSGYFGSSPLASKSNPSTPFFENQYFSQGQITSPISLHGRRPSVSSMSPVSHRRNNQSITSFSSMPEEMVVFKAR